MPYYVFFWGRHDDEKFLARIEADADTVEKLLDEYRKADPETYNADDFMEFLKEKGIDAEKLEPEWIYF